MVTCGYIVKIVKIVDVSPVMFLFTPVVDLIKIADLAIFARIILHTTALLSHHGIHLPQATDAGLS